MTTRDAGDGFGRVPEIQDPELIRACVVLITLYTTDRFVALRPAAEPDLELVMLQTRKNVFSVRSINTYQKLSALFRSISAAPHTWLLFDMTTRTCRFASFSEARSIIGSAEND